MFQDDVKVHFSTLKYISNVFNTNIVEDPLVTLLAHSRCTLDTYPDICGMNYYLWYLR